MTPEKREQYRRFKGCNVMLISIDALRADHLGIYGYKRNTSPIIDTFAKTGVGRTVKLNPDLMKQLKSLGYMK